MKTLTINVPDNFDVSQEKQNLAKDWYASGKLSATQAAEIAGLNVSIFLAMAEPLTKTDRLVQTMAKPVAADFNLSQLKRDKQYTGLNWTTLDQLADQIGLVDTTEDLLTQLGK